MLYTESHMQFNFELNEVIERETIEGHLSFIKKFLLWLHSIFLFQLRQIGVVGKIDLKTKFKGRLKIIMSLTLIRGYFSMNFINYLRP